MSRNVQTQGPDEIVETFEAEDVPQDFAVQSQYQAGKNARGNRKKINTTMRNERKLGAFKGKNPETGKRWKKHEKKLYAAKLLSGTGETGGVGVGGQNYESNKMVFQKNTGDTENQTYTNINDSKYRTNEQINPETGDLEQKNIAMYEPKDESTSASKMLGVTPLKSKISKIMKSVEKGKKISKVDNYKIIKKDGSTLNVKDGKVKPETGLVKKNESVVQAGPSGTTSSAGNVNFKSTSKAASNAADSAGDAAKSGSNLKGTKSFATRAGETFKKVKGYLKPGIKTGIAAGAVGGYLLASRGADDVKPNTEGGGPGGGGTGGGGTSNNNNTNNTTTPPKRTTGTTKVNGIRRDLPVAKPSSNPVSVSDSLSTSSNRAAERQANRDTRIEARQGRRQQRLDNRQARRAQRRANPTLVGGALRRTFGGKKMDTNINNMGNYNQNDKKKNGQFGGTSRPGYNA